MADNIKVSPSLRGEAVNVATHDINGVHFPQYMGWETAIARGFVPGHSYIHKFGAINGLTTDLTPVCQGGFYRTPTSPVTLAAISTDADDTAAGAGAQQLTLEYLDSNFTEQTATIEMNGLTETTDSISGVTRLYRAYISRSGTYATQASPSQQGTITIRVSGAGDTWAVIPQIGAGFGIGQSLIGSYTVPAGKTAYILRQTINVDANKPADVYFFKRENADDTGTPFTGVMRLQNQWIGVANAGLTFEHSSMEEYPALTDIGFLAKMQTGTGDVTVEFELFLVDDE